MTKGQPAGPIRVRIDGEPLVWTVVRLLTGAKVEVSTSGRRLVVPLSSIRIVDEPPIPEAPT